MRESTDHPVLRAAMQVGIDRVNATRSLAASIRAFAILAVGPLLGVVAMARLRGTPEAVKMAGGRR